MPFEEFGGRQIRVKLFDDVTSGEFVVEFVDPAISASDSVVAVFNVDPGWSGARISISPKVKDVSAEFLLWALEAARRIMEGSAE
jgi:hypothetical protein